MVGIVSEDPKVQGGVMTWGRSMPDKVPLRVPVRVMATRNENSLNRAIAWWLLGQGLTPPEVAKAMGYTSQEEAWEKGTLPRPTPQMRGG